MATPPQTVTAAVAAAYPPGHEPVHNYLREPGPGPDVHGLKRFLAIAKEWLTTVDHKRIGIMYLISVATFFSVGGLLALAVRLELFTLGHTIMDADAYNRVFTMHGIVMVFAFIIPSVMATLGNFLLPLMIGAKDVAFPKLNLINLYIY